MSRTTVIGLITYKRPRMLSRAIQSISHLKIPEGEDITFVLVDNDYLESAKGVFDEWESVLPVKSLYDVEPEKSIPLARNRVIDISRRLKADHLCFFDDDEVVDPYWLCNLLDFAGKYGCAAIKGRQEIEYLGVPPDWILRGGFFDIRMNWAHGDLIGTAATSNVMYDFHFLTRRNLRFDYRCGLTGGSDRIISAIIRREGGEIRYCEDAITIEYITESRLTFRWLAKRSYSSGNSKGRKSILVEGWKNHIKRFPVLLVKKFLKGLHKGARGIYRADKSEGAEAVLLIAEMLGYIAAGAKIHYREYEEHHGH